MKNCKDCKYAEWKRTKLGRLHPSGDGECGYKLKWKMLSIPASMFWPGNMSHKPCGGYINRREDLKEHCVYYSED